MGDGDAVDRQQKQNPAHAGVTSFYLINHETFELLGGPFGGDDKHKDGIDPRDGPVTISRDEMWPVGTEEFDNAKKNGSVAQYVETHRVKSRFVYVFSVVDGQFFDVPTFRYELFVDDRGRVFSLSRDNFETRHADAAAVAEEPNDDYVKGTTWEGGKQKFFQLKLPLIKHNKGVSWHFFALPFHLSKEGVERIEQDADILSPDPGFDPGAPEKAKVDGLTIWRGGSRVAVDSGMLVRVLDPLRVAGRMHAELGARVDEYVQFALPVGKTARSHRTQRRTLISAVAGCTTNLLDRSNNVDLKPDTIHMASETWPKLENHCFTPEEVRTLNDLTPTKASLMKSVRGHEYFLAMEKRLREEYERRQCKAATQLLLWLTSRPWAFIEREHFALTWRTEAFGHFFVCVMSNGLSRACDTDMGRNYLNALIEACEEKPDNDAVPNAFTTQQYIIRDKPKQSGHDHAKTVIKAGKAPYDFWSKLVTLYGAKNKAFLKTMLAKKSFDPAVIAKLEKLTEEKKVFSLAALVMAKRLNRNYGFRMVETDITQVFAPEGKKAVVIFASNPQGDGIDRSFCLVFETPDDLDNQIEKARKDAGLVKPEPHGFRKLTFDHVSTVMGFVNMYFSARELYLSVKNENALDATKSAFKLLSSMYTMPWVQKRLASKMQDFSLSFLAKETNEWISKRGIPIVAFALQAITVAFAAEDLWKKTHEGTTEAVVGSALCLAGEIMILISMGMVVSSGGVLTPAAAAVALIGPGLSVSSFVYTQFIPTDHERALLDCLFGKDFPSGATGRPWQACPSKQLRAYNHAGKQGKQELDAYRRQISAFSNLMHNFNLQVTLSDNIMDRAATITIKPSAVPRTAYFEVKLVMTWWVTGEDDDVTWTGECSFFYFPYRDNVPPLLPPANDNLTYNAMNNAGVVMPTGGAFQIFAPQAGASPIELSVSPRNGEPETWTGELKNIVGGVRKPIRVAARYNEDYRIRSQVSLDGKELRIELEFLPGTTEDMTVANLEVTVAFQRYIETRPVGVTEQKTFDPERTVQGNKHQRETIRFIVPIESDNLGQRRVAGFRIGMVYRDNRLGEPRIRPKET
ncbi:MAG: hypothetical protein JKY37_30695, partial [Nannocystaceae bacterium]|nr:hypothetical protein [Nannocystaceae bacterium]